MNEIMWKGKTYSGMTVDNGIIINDGDEVTTGNEVTIGLQKAGGYRNFLGDQGRRFICQGNLVLMGKCPVEERLDIKQHWKKSNDNGETWTDMTQFNNSNLLNDMNVNLCFKNTSNESKITGINSTEYNFRYSSNTIYKYQINSILFSGTDNSYLINLIKPTDLYNKVYIGAGQDALTNEIISPIPFANRINNPNSYFIKTEIISADLNDYKVKLVMNISSTFSLNIGTYLIPRESNVLGMFLYCTGWSEEKVRLGIGVAGFEVSGEDNYKLTAFFPIGNFYFSNYRNPFDTTLSLEDNPKNYAWYTYYQISKSNSYLGEGYYYQGAFYQDSDHLNPISEQDNKLLKDLTTENYYIGVSSNWVLHDITGENDEYLFTPDNSKGSSSIYQQLTLSPEYEYAAQVTQQYNYIDRATYHSLVPGDSNG